MSGNFGLRRPPELGGRRDEAVAFERAAQNRNIDSAVASAAGASGIHLRKATCSISSQRAAEGAQEMVPVFSGGRIG